MNSCFFGLSLISLWLRFMHDAVITAIFQNNWSSFLVLKCILTFPAILQPKIFPWHFPDSQEEQTLYMFLSRPRMACSILSFSISTFKKAFVMRDNIFRYSFWCGDWSDFIQPRDVQLLDPDHMHSNDVLQIFYQNRITVQAY